MIEVRETDISCGVWEIYGIKGRENDELLEEVSDALFESYRKGNNGIGADRYPAFLIFSNTDKKFADYVAKKKFGKVTTKGPLVNPNTKNKIYMSVWELKETDRKKFCKWWKKQNCSCSCD